MTGALGQRREDLRPPALVRHSRVQDRHHAAVGVAPEKAPDTLADGSPGLSQVPHATHGCLGYGADTQVCTAIFIFTTFLWASKNASVAAAAGHAAHQAFFSNVDAVPPAFARSFPGSG
jgi:hypothetical protein